MPLRQQRRWCFVQKRGYWCIQPNTDHNAHEQTHHKPPPTRVGAPMSAVVSPLTYHPRDTNAPKNKQTKTKTKNMHPLVTAMYNWNYVGVIKTYVPFIWSYIDLNVPQRRSTRYLVPTILSAPKLVSLNRQVIRETGMSAKHSMWSFVTVQMNTNEILSEQTFY